MRKKIGLAFLLAISVSIPSLHATVQEQLMKKAREKIRKTVNKTAEREAHSSPLTKLFGLKRTTKLIAKHQTLSQELQKTKELRAQLEGRVSEAERAKKWFIQPALGTAINALRNRERTIANSLKILDQNYPKLRKIEPK